eukprot:gnl/TRDRNA2_/TRDRNA2_170371_c2_seq2.p1 gnl/TRDRNA2_/TRDRNA2_170371_c2~~gnl/TRDRNA2_/TRDRNA2_170371_c2_seq2.p1  ORF type:complete len:128 (+),score=11.81 gnl/TRDRNA2_/TRDRNA2_170371_c2_seq2:59-442(+)
MSIVSSAANSAATFRLVFAQVGHCVPPQALGSTNPWLARLVGREEDVDFDRRTMVMPRPGDGWYAPPAGGGANAPFPWGELTSVGAAQMRALGSRVGSGLAVGRTSAGRPRRRCGLRQAYNGHASPW